MAKTLTAAQLMRVALDNGWAVVVLEHGRRFNVRLWARDRVRSVDAVHGTFACALREAIRCAFAAQARQDQDQDQDLDRDQDRPRGVGSAPPPGPALPTPELLTTVLQTVCEVVA